jgi:hypothetical protein
MIRRALRAKYLSLPEKIRSYLSSLEFGETLSSNLRMVITVLGLAASTWQGRSVEQIHDGEAWRFASF